jgi:DNA invertase Pin-like site-specific DNA recombinase
MTKKAIELVRVSTEGQAAEDRAGIPAQRAANKRTALQYGLTIIKTIEIIDVAGTAVLRSPGMQELLRLMESSDVHGVIAKEFSRLMRPENFSDYALLQHFIETKTFLYLPDGPLDFSSEAGKLLGGIRALIAGQERREMLRRLQDAKEAMRRAGKNAGGASVLPYGVGYSKVRGWYYTPEIEKVKRAFQLFLGDETSYERIGRELNIPRQNIRFILMNPIYVGRRVYRERRDPSPEAYVPRPNGCQGYRKKMNRSPEETFEVRVLDPIISEDVFARVQEIIESNRQRRSRARATSANRYLYNGFLSCGQCTEPVYTHASQQDYYVCKSHHPRERRKRALDGLQPCANRFMLRKKLEPRIDHVLAEMLWEPDFLRRVVDEYNDTFRRVPVAEFDHLAITAKIQALRGKKERVLETFFDGIINKQERDLRVEEIQREITTYELMLLHAADGPPRAQGADLDRVLALVEPFAEWEFLDREARRTLLSQLRPKISVFQYTIKDLTLDMVSETGGGYTDSHLRTGR